MARLRKAARIWRHPAAQTAARRVMISQDGPVFTIEPAKLFPRIAPLEVECGAGKGDFIIERAASMPDRDFLAVELAGSVARMLAVRAGRIELNNLIVLRADARTLVNLLMPDRSAAAYHIYFPDPWPKKRQAKHRLFTPWFVANLRRALAPEGRVFVATDVRDYAGEIFAMLELAGFARLDEPVPGAHRSGFGRKYAEAGRTVSSGTFGLI
jgi:tRNA (guanine-N7-)-methyltransferase